MINSWSYHVLRNIWTASNKKRKEKILMAPISMQCFIWPPLTGHISIIISITDFSFYKKSQACKRKEKMNIPMREMRSYLLWDPCMLIVSILHNTYMHNWSSRERSGRYFEKTNTHFASYFDALRCHDRICVVKLGVFYVSMWSRKSANS